MWAAELFSKASDEPEDQRQQNAQHDGGDDGEVEGGVLAAIDDVAGEASDGEVEASAEQKQQTEEDEEAAEGDQDFAEIGHRRQFRVLGIQLPVELPGKLASRTWGAGLRRFQHWTSRLGIG
jgi:hypothetical protein